MSEAPPVPPPSDPNEPGLRALSHIAKTFSAFSIPAYRLYWMSQVTSTTGMQVQMFARGLLAYELGGNAGSIGLVSLGQAIPQLLLSMVGGTVADRIERRKMMMLGQTFTALSSVVIALMVRGDMMTVPYLFIAGLLQGLLFAFVGPARQAFLPEVVGEKELMNAMALNNAAMNLSRIGAPSLAGALVAVSWIDLGGLYFIQAGLNIFSLCVLFLLPRAIRAQTKRLAASPAVAGGPPPSLRRRPPRTGTVLSELKDGIRYIRRSPILLTLLALGLVPTLLGQSYQQFLPLFAQDVFGDGVDRNAHALGFMGTMSGAGAMVGALTVASLTDYKRRTLLQLGAGVGFGFFVAMFAAQDSYAPAIMALVGVGFMSSFFQSLNSTMVMSATDPEYYGRVMSVNMLTFSMQSFGTFGIGYIIDWVGHVQSGPIDLLGVQFTFLAIGLIIMAFIMAVTVFNPSYRRLEQADLRAFREGAPAG